LSFSLPDNHRIENPCGDTRKRNRPATSLETDRPTRSGVPAIPEFREMLGQMVSAELVTSALHLCNESYPCDDSLYLSA
jgi:hypothetical protein